MKKFLFFCIYLLFTVSINAQSTKKVKGEVIERVDESYSIKEFKENLFRKAQIDALAKAFGTNITSSSDLRLDNTAMELNSFNNSSIKGEWIKTLQITYEWNIDIENNQQVLYLSCNVEGKARAIDTPTLNYHVATLSCPDQKCETTLFKEMQHFYASLTSPKDGYISIYMRENDKVYRLFPYSTLQGELTKPYPVKADVPYVFFDPNNTSHFENISSRQVDQLVLSTMGPKRIVNRLYFIYCPEEYDKPVLRTEQGGIKTLSPEEFQEWLSIQKTNKKDFQEKIVYFSVEQ